MVQSGERTNSGERMDDPWHVLRTLSYDAGDVEYGTREQLSKKPIDVFVRRIFEMKPELKEQTSSMLQLYTARNLKLPFVHITPDAIEYDDGGVVSTGNVENILKSGFLPGDSNVGGFLRAGEHYNSVGRPESFKEPEDFLKSYIVLLRHYLHHATRTNHRNSGTGVKEEITTIKPAFVFVKGDLKAEHGTDYEDHFILRDGSRPEDVVGVMSVNEKINMNDIDSVLDSYTKLLNKLDEILEH